MDKKKLKQKLKNLEKFQNDFEIMNDWAKDDDVYVLEEYKDIILYSFIRCKKNIQLIIDDEEI